MRSERGQSAAEFAMILPIAMALMLGLFDIGRIVWAADGVAHAAAEAARFAIVRGGSASNPCPVGPAAGEATVPAPSASCPFPSPSKQAIVQRALGRAWAVGGSVRVQVCYGQGCSGTTDVAGVTNARGTPVTVTVSADLGLVASALLNAGPFTVTGTSTMIVNH